MKRICLQCRRGGFDPWVGKIPCKSDRLPIPVFLLGDFHGEPGELQSTGLQRVRHDQVTNILTFTFIFHYTYSSRWLWFTHSVLSDSLPPHGRWHARLPCPLLSPGICSNSCLMSWWCHPNSLSSAAQFTFFPQYYPASGSFPVSQIFLSGGQSFGASASTSVQPMCIHDWFP